MHERLVGSRSHMDRMRRALFVCGVAALSTLGWDAPRASAQDAGSGFDPAVRPEFREPTVLASKDGVLEVRLTARQGQATLDTVAKPVQNFLLFDYELIQGTASDGRSSGGNLYPAPTLQVFPGETLIVHLDNGLTGLTIKDYFSPQYTAKGEPVPIYPVQLTSSPFNLHVHGIHVSPEGQFRQRPAAHPGGDVEHLYLRHPANMPQGAYWYHSHLHTPDFGADLYGPRRTARHRPDRRQPAAGDREQHPDPQHAAPVQFRVRSRGRPRAAEQHELAPVCQHHQAAARRRAGQRDLPPAAGAGQFHRVEAGRANTSRSGTRGRSRSATIVACSSPSRATCSASPRAPAAPSWTCPRIPSLPDYQRDVQFTVNGQFQPVIASKAGQTEIWVLANVSDFAYMNVQLTETATGRHPPIAIVGQDGNPYPGRALPADRRRHPAADSAGQPIRDRRDDTGRGRARARDAAARRWRQDDHRAGRALHQQRHRQPAGGARQPERPAFGGQLCRRLLRLPDPGAGESRAFAGSGCRRPPLSRGSRSAPTPRSSSSPALTPDVKREIKISGGFLNDLASTSDPKAFVYAFDGAAFPNMPLIQPRLDSVEEWTFVNHNNDEHPIHVHVNDFQVIDYFDPTTGLRTGPNPWGMDNANVAGADHADRRERDPARHPFDAHAVRRLYRPVRDALPSPQPRGQRADGAHQRHPGGVDLRGGHSGRGRQADAGAGVRRQR